MLTASTRLVCAEEDDIYAYGEILPVVYPIEAADSYVKFRDELQRVRRSAFSDASELKKRLGSSLANWRRHGTTRLRAASTSALAHWARAQQKRSERGERAKALPEAEADPIALLEEALAHEPSAIRYIELAEALAAEHRSDEARRLLRHAQRLAPRHPIPARWLPRR
jgi:Flp pilus assembly protein TadD